MTNTFNQDNYFTIQSLILEEMKREYEEEGKQNRYFRRLAKLLAKVNAISGHERAFKITKL